MFDQRAGGHFLRQRIVFRALIDTEIRRSEQLLNQDNLRAFAVRFAYQAFSVGNVFSSSQVQAIWVAATVTFLMSVSKAEVEGAVNKHNDAFILRCDDYSNVWRYA
jgi:hypothetical protein